MPSEWHHAIQFDIILESKYFLNKIFLIKNLSVKIIESRYKYISKNNAN